jgi:hypothetical protein
MVRAKLVNNVKGVVCGMERFIKECCKSWEVLEIMGMEQGLELWQRLWYVFDCASMAGTLNPCLLGASVVLLAAL